MIAKVDNGCPVRLDAVAQRHRRMMQILDDDARATNLVRALAELAEIDRGRQLADLDRKVGELHLAGQYLAQISAASLRTANGYLITGNEQRRKKRKALDMIPVRVAEQNRCRERVSWLCCVRHEVGAERTGAGAAVEDETRAIVGLHTHTRGVATITNRVRPRCGD